MTMTDKDILHAAQQHMGHTAWPTLVMSFVVVAIYFGVFAAALFDILPLALCFVLISYMVYAVYTPLHESVHNNIAGNNKKLDKLNNVIGHIVGSILGIPYAVHRPAHMAHHRSTNIPGEDPDLVFTSGSFFDVLLGGPKIIVNEYRYYFKKIYPTAKRSDRILVWAEILIALGWRAGIALAGYPLEAFVLGVLGSLAGVSLLGTIFAWIVHTPFNETERYKNTATIFLPAWLHRVGTFLWLWQNYHSIHHLFPRVPFYNYRRVYELIEPGMQERGAPVMGRPVPVYGLATGTGARA